MKLFGIDIRISRVGAAAPAAPARGGWVSVVRESYPGAWQQNVAITRDGVSSYAPVMACVRLIATDIAKMRCRLVVREDSGIWTETESAAFSPFLRKPNHYQSRIKFFEAWMVSKLLHGNTYVLKERDQRGVVIAGYVLEPTRVRVLIGPDGSVWYELAIDPLAGLPASVTVPQSEIMHDLYLPLCHPLIGITPIMACALGTGVAIKIQENSAAFFAGGSQPGGVISAPGPMSPEQLKRVEKEWNDSFTGNNVGKTAVLAGGMKYDQLSVNATDAQLIDQLHWTAENVCQAFAVPPHKISAGPAPNLAGSVQALDLQDDSQCLQELIENLEETLDLGLGLAPDTIDGTRMGTEFDRTDLLQMDTASRVEAATKTTTGGVLSPNEARVRWMDAPPVPGGDSPMMQQQQFSLEALAERDKAQPFAKPAAPALPPDATPAAPDTGAEDAQHAASVAALLRAALQLDEVAA